MSVFTVVIPARNAAHTLGEQLEALCAQTYHEPFEVIVVDNGSTDPTVHVAGAFRTRLELRVVFAPQAQGASGARNAGAHVAHGDRLVFTDADDVVAPGWLDAYASVDAVLATGPIPRFRDGDTPAHTVGAAAPPTMFGYLPYGAGTNLLVSRALFDELGGFDVGYRAGEDVEFCWRAQLGGDALTFVPGAVVAKRDPARAVDRFRQYAAYGRYDARLYRDFRDQGAPRPDLRTDARAYAGIVARLPGIGRAETRDRVVRQLGRRAGRLAGSVRYRVFLP
jgi:glycosyltransferase involved in cell wall biosynthesis